MAKAIAIFVGGIQELRQVAVREDGAVFKRFQEKDPRFGYRWSAWKPTGEVLGENARNGIEDMPSGFCTLHRASPKSPCVNDAALFDRQGQIRVRLPN